MSSRSQTIEDEHASAMRLGLGTGPRLRMGAGHRIGARILREQALDLRAVSVGARFGS